MLFQLFFTVQTQVVNFDGRFSVDVALTQGAP